MNAMERLEKNMVTGYKDAGHVAYTFLTLPRVLGPDGYGASMNIEASEARLEIYENVGEMLDDYRTEIQESLPDDEQDDSPVIVSYRNVRAYLSDLRMKESARHAEMQEAFDSDRMITYQVRGLTPLENRTMNSIMRMVKPPRPPLVKKPVGDPGGKLDARSLQFEEVENVNDPSYLQAMEQYEEALQVGEYRSIAFTLMSCVKGFDLTDDEIHEALNEKAKPRTPLESLCERLDQVSEIILKNLDTTHMLAIQRRINDLTGRRVDDVNFT